MVMFAPIDTGSSKDDAGIGIFRRCWCKERHSTIVRTLILFTFHVSQHKTYTHTNNSIEAVESVQKSGKICVLDIDVQGVRKVKESSLTRPIYIFIAPPSKAELEKRLRGRATESEEAIATRLANAAAELDYGQTTGNFDRVFVNADLKECFESMAKQFQEWYPHLVEMASGADDDDDEPKSCTCLIS